MAWCGLGLFLAWVFDAEGAERGAECAEKGILRFA